MKSLLFLLLSSSLAFAQSVGDIQLSVKKSGFGWEPLTLDNTADTLWSFNASGVAVPIAKSTYALSASPSFTGQGTIVGADNPVWDIRRTTVGTSSIAGTGQMTAISSGNAADGFGPILSFRISDTGVSDELIGALGFVRAGADNTGDFVVRPQVSGSGTERFRVTSAGDLLLGGVASTGTGGVVRANSPTFTGTVSGITKAMVGLGSVDNTADLAKPVSTAQQTALNGKADTGHDHVSADITDATLGGNGAADAGKISLFGTGGAFATTDRLAIRKDGTAFVANYDVSNLTATRTYQSPNASGTLALTSDLSAYALDSALTSGLAGKANLTGGNTITGTQSFAGGMFFQSTEGGTDGITIPQDAVASARTLSWPSNGGTFAIAAATSGRVAPTDMTGLGTGVSAALTANTNAAGGIVTPAGLVGGTLPGSFTTITTNAGNVDTLLTLRSGGAAKYFGIQLGRTGSDYTLGVAAAGNQFCTGSAAGDGIIQANTTGTLHFVTNGGQTAALKLTPTAAVFDANHAVSILSTLAVTGNLTASGYNAETPDSRSGPGAVSVTAGTTALTTTGVADALTLANGVAGQRKTIAHDVDGGSAVLTPTTKAGFSTVTFTNVGETVTLQYFTTRGWMVVSSYGAVVAP